MFPNKSCLLNVVVIHVWVYLLHSIILCIDVEEEKLILETIIPCPKKWLGSCAVQVLEKIHFQSLNFMYSATHPVDLDYLCLVVRSQV